MAADLHKAGLGLSEEDEARIVNEVQFVIHSAASISFFEHIHTLLEQNYEVSAHPHPPSPQSAGHGPFPRKAPLQPLLSGVGLSPTPALRKKTKLLDSLLR